MKRLPGKIKDFVDLQVFDEVQDFFVNPARALAAYRFTDATSDLLARWLDTLANLPHGQGAALALAGLRGCGKSHALAVFSALLSVPHLRAGAADAHVAASARRLSDRRFVVVYVRRGILPTLTDELVAGFSARFGGDVSWGTEPAAMIETARRHSPDASLVVIVDTAFGRTARVSRDDGPLLSELARAAVKANAMIILALDDDISGADGVNVALASSYQICYLDPEHIYRVADLYLLRKNAQARDFLHDVYARLRLSVPGFNWSQQRFTCTYPVHPIIADLSSAVRLYAPTFAFLPFAAAAAGHALARPALSLVVLDEVFDRVEADLRATQELKPALAAYDHLANEVIAQLPVMRRLQAKLTLKGLFVLSLDGRGATARELSAAMLFYDETDAEASIKRVEEILRHFAQAAPPDSLEQTAYGDSLRYCFNVTGSSGFDAALAKRAAALENCDAEIDRLLHAGALARFPDWPLIDENRRTIEQADFSFVWRGADRPGRLLWQTRDGSSYLADDDALKDKLFYDWKIAVLPPGVTVAEEVLRAKFDVWAPAPPTAEEKDTLRRLVALHADEQLFTQYEETALAAETMLEARAKLIWTRLFVDEGALVVDGERRQFTDAARGAPTLGEALAQMFAAQFDERYPAHPQFASRLDEDEVTNLVGGLFVGAHLTDATSQRLAKLFAAPLGLTAARGDGMLMPEAGARLTAHAWVKEILDLVNAADGATVAVDQINRILRDRPYGLLREPQQLILAALVAQRRLEFVLATGERLNRQALEGPLHWDRITGVAAPISLLQGAEELTAWAGRLAKQQDLPALSDDESRAAIGEALTEWLAEWHASDLVTRGERIPEEALTTRAADLTAAVRRSFGAAAQAVEAALAGHIALEEGLQRVSDSFGNSVENYEHELGRLEDLSAYLAEMEWRAGVRDYVLLAEATGVNEIENMRGELLRLTEDVHASLDPELRRRHRALWQDFQARYAAHFAQLHDQTTGDELHRAVDDVTNGDEWREFEMLSLNISLVNKQYWHDAELLQRRAKEARCDLPVRTLLAARPFCYCQFRLARVDELLSVPEDLRHTVERGRIAHRRTLEMWSRHLSGALRELAANDGARQTGDAALADKLSTLFGEGALPFSFSHHELRLIEQALQNTVLPPVRIEWPAGGYGLLTRQELHERLVQWMEEMPEHPALIEVTAESAHGGDEKI